MLRVTLLLVMAVSSVLAINFPSSSRPSRPSSPARDRLVFSRQTFTTASCTDSSQSLSTVVLSPGEGRVFQSPNYPANYPDGQTCTYNFEPAVGAQLVFSCSDVDLTATSSPGALCTGDYLRYSTVQYSTVQYSRVQYSTVQYSTAQYSTGDYLRFYDETGVLGQSGTRYCFSDSPAFTYTTNIKVLFKTNNDGTTGKGNYAEQSF